MELLSESEVDSRLAELDGWNREGETIVKTFKLADFVGSVEFVDKLVQPAEDMGHHPDLTISFCASESSAHFCFDTMRCRNVAIWCQPGK